MRACRHAVIHHSETSSHFTEAHNGTAILKLSSTVHLREHHLGHKYALLWVTVQQLKLCSQLGAILVVCLRLMGAVAILGGVAILPTC